MLGIDKTLLRVAVPDMGGGFGARGGVYPEFPLLLVAARRLGRPVKWAAERAESFLTDTQARDHLLRGELALDTEGRFTALRVAIDWRHGAYIASRGIWVMVAYLAPTLGGPYRIPTGHIAMRGLFSNTTPLGAYRGIGRVESNYLMESLVDAAAVASGIDRIELRRRNLVQPAEMPWQAPGGACYHLGEFAANLERAIDLSDWGGFAGRREATAAEGLLRGIGLAMYVENDGGTPTEFAEIEAAPDGAVTAYVGTQDFGMGHSTMYAQVLSSQLGVAFERIRVVFGDTDRVARGTGSHGSRSARLGGGAVVGGASKLVERGTELAAEMLEASAGDIEYRRGRFVVAGTDRAVDLGEVAGFAEARGERLSGAADFATERETHSNGCHVCEVTVDPADGKVRIVRHTVVADVGRAINPLIVHGQLHGGAVQGLGQALMEEVVYDPDGGQMLSGSYMDYVLPRADDLPFLTVELNEQAETDNPLGAKGAGESATTGAPGAVMNAIRDALGLDAGPLDMPATSERVWRALRRVQPPAKNLAARSMPDVHPI
jgi:carbon-monoxide dehydrogenase large subunit